METSKLKRFAQYARRSLIEQVGSKLSHVLSDESQEGREHPEAVDKLNQKIAASDKAQVIEQVAYTWFNRFCALRFMDANEYSRIMVVSPLPGQFQPEILAEAKAGHIDDSIVDEKTRNKIFNLLNATEASRDPQAEAYRLLIVAVCNDYHRIMPYLFERIEGYTELLMPDDLLSGNSILAYTREAMTPDACESVESIGWLYQFYISEKKDDVFAGLKNNIKITPENIPAATQLFTPHWIVRYLVENSLGRLWMLNNPNSKVIEQMDYYIKPAPAAEGKQQEETEFLKISSPEEIKICDPACGSGHMLTYAYDLLYAIYLDDGRVDPTDIPEKILTNNLYGIEIDERASELAAFALTMKAVKGNPLDDGNNRRRFFRNPVKPNVCRIEKIEFTDVELNSYIDFVGKDLFTQDLISTLKEFEEADNFGSLIQPTLKSPQEAIVSLEVQDVSGQLFLTETHESVLKVLEQAEYLSSKYHVVIANPPYMGGKGMNSRLSKWAKDNYPNSKSDLMTAFMERSMSLNLPNGLWGMINLPSWMFLSSFEKLRVKLLSSNTINSLIHLGRGIFGSDFGSVAFVLKNSAPKGFERGVYRRLFEEHVKVRKSSQIEKLYFDEGYGFFEFEQNKFKDIPSNPIAYWLSEDFLKAFSLGVKMQDYAIPRQGFATGKNDDFLRQWHEVSIGKTKFDSENIDSAISSGAKWFPCNKGGPFRKWYGNNSIVVNWKNDGEAIKSFDGSVIRNPSYYFKEGITWSTVSISSLSMRYSPKGFLFESKGSVCFPLEGNSYHIPLALMNTKVVEKVLLALSPTVDFHEGPIGRIPVIEDSPKKVKELANKAIELAKHDWDDFEVSWDFVANPLVRKCSLALSVAGTFMDVRNGWDNSSRQLKEIEEENNTIFIDAYGLTDELDRHVSLEDITLNCNPLNRYRSKKTKVERTEAFLEDTIIDFISYYVGCVFGRYSLDQEGLILANQDGTIEDYLKKIPNLLFKPCDDNVIPLINLELEKGKQDDWFEDDISERFKVFLKVTFGTENFDENLRFIEEAIGKDIKKFFLKDFYTDHIKRYKKRPIYWLFSSPKGSFNALIYMHRYRSDTVSVVLNDYLCEFRTKLEAKKESYEQMSISASAEPADKTKALKAIEKIKAVLEEVKDYERDILYPLASQNIEIDLDDGVKHNYPLFGKALKKVTGLS